MFITGKIRLHERKTMMRIPEKTIECIKKYYLDEKNCFICPGKKDCVTTKDS